MLVLSDESVAEIPVSPDTPLILSRKSDRSGEFTAGVSPVPNFIVDEILVSEGDTVYADQELIKFQN